MAGFTGFGSPMKPLGQMWAQPTHQQAGQLPPMGGMQAPGAPQMGQGAPNGQFPLNPQGGQMMTPGGGSTGGPLQGNPQLQPGQMPMQGQLPSYQMPQQPSIMQMQGHGMQPQMQQFRSDLQDWRQQRPQFGQGGFDRSQFQDWRSQRPQFPVLGGGFMHPMGG